MFQEYEADRLFSPRDPDCTGIDIFITDSKPQSPPLETVLPGEEVPKWFSARSTGLPRAMRLLSRYQQHLTNIGYYDPLPYSRDVIMQAIWSPNDYYHLWHNPAGGSAALLSPPWRFVMQTPSDGGSFCSFALSVEGHWVKGVYSYSDPSYSPTRIFEGQTIQSGWLQHGMQIVSLPLAFLGTHCARMARDLAAVVAQVSSVESVLSGTSSTTRQSSNGTWDFEPLLRTLHTSSTTLVNLERRSKFELGLISSIEDVLATAERDLKRE